MDELAVRDQVGIVARRDMAQPFWRTTTVLNANIQHASLTDCFAVALALRVGGAIVTGDHPGFEPITGRGFRPVNVRR